MATKKDFTQVAYGVFKAAIREAPKPFTDKQISGRKGGLTGGKKRMEALTPDQRLELAAKGVAARKTPASSGAGVRKIAKASR